MKPTGLKSVIAAFLFFTAVQARCDIVLAWNPSPDPTVTNYTVFWGTNTGVYTFQANAGDVTNYDVTGLNPGMVYYFAVMATAGDGTQSALSSELEYTNPVPVVPTPPTPPVTGGTNTGTTNTAGGAGTNNNNIAGGGNGGTGGTATPASGVVIPGIPPSMTLTISNNSPWLALSSTVGATIAIQSTTNFANPDAWVTMTNLPITNIAVGVTNTNQGNSTLNLAFVPGAQTYQVLNPPQPFGEFYRLVMPYDYMVLADAVLGSQGYPSRLLLVRMPGVVSDDLCYVTPQNSYISYTATNNSFSLQPSGSTIRQIATTLSSTLGLDWTSASEFSYSNGVSTILATVVKTAPANTDPVAGAATADIQIDF